MTKPTLPELTATALIAGFAAREFTPSELLEACLDRISRLNPAVNALTAFATERAVAEAARASRRWQLGTPLGPLDGLPIGVKDLQDAEGLPTTHGSPRFRSGVANADLPMVARLRRAGAIVLAKTNVPEFGAGANTRNPVWGATGNPFDPRLTAGGSSGGSAAALAADLVPLCTGSDTGGSLRVPAALCGVVGFRPSADLIAHPTRPVGWSAISVLGPMARTMDDMLLMLRACTGGDIDDPLSCAAAADRVAELPEMPLASLRVGVSEDFGDLPLDPAIWDTFRARVATVAPHVRECRPIDLDLGEMDRVFDILRAESFLATFDNAQRDAPDAFGPHISANLDLGRTMTLADRAWAHAEQTRILRRFNHRMAGLDAVLLPTSPVSPFPWMQSHVAEIDGRQMDIYYRWLGLTYRGSLMGGPSITLPAGRDPHGLPFGLQLLGPVRGDARLLAAARAIEALLQQDSETARPRPDPAGLVPPPVDLRAIVTHPPLADRTTDHDKLGTAV